MLALIQRVTQARVEVAGDTVGEIGAGLLVLVCAEPADSEAECERLLVKLLRLRIFGDAAGKMNLSLQDTAGGLLLVSQFTLAADTRSGNRPGFSGAAEPGLGRRLFEHLVQLARAAHSAVASGRFGADMQVHLVNDGPVTIPLRIEPRAGTVAG
ncbi:D-aminoacyl-tRNA deacylase [Ottowia sp.]|uniref:D-aminoacyl-tRNA deacylase n=1 Tax=Ottowia sp. TaxID=1898956 RepID=UPI00345EBBD4